MPSHSELVEYINSLRTEYGSVSVIGTTAHATQAIYDTDLTQPLIMMIGCETDGLSLGLREYCTDLVTIPMAEGCAASSFNVACAATVMFYEAKRQRSVKGTAR